MIDTGQTIVAVATSLGLCEQTLGQWIKDERKRRFVDCGVQPDVEQLQAENERLHRELAKVRLEKEFLEKAAAFFGPKQQQHNGVS